ncbi:MAG: hypothetical protein ACKVWR_05770 [Acidimicrobiales bacterium]
MPSEPTEPTPPSGLTVSDDHFAEQYPLSPIDDYLIHQTPDPIRVMWSSDPRVYERYWMVAHDDGGELLVATGGSFYPNLDRAEAWAIVNLRGRHIAVRGFRPLGVDRVDLRCGPINPTILQGMRLWRYELDENEWGVRYDLQFWDTHRAVFREPVGAAGSGHPKGRRPDVTTGFEGFGEVEGWVEVDGERFRFERGSARGTRDRHWGIGRGVGGPELALGGRMHVGVSGNSFVAFSTFTIWGDRVFYPLGDPRRGMGRVVAVDRRLRFEPDTKVFVEGLVDYTLDTGEVKRLHWERIGFQTAYLRCGMYGGTPEGGIHQGGWAGEERVEGDRYDVTDPAVRIKLSGLDEHLCRVTCDGETTTGLYQPIDPNAYNACAAGRPGWAFLA